MDEMMDWPEDFGAGGHRWDEGRVEDEKTTAYTPWAAVRVSQGTGTSVLRCAYEFGKPGVTFKYKDDEGSYSLLSEADLHTTWAHGTTQTCWIRKSGMSDCDEGLGDACGVAMTDPELFAPVREELMVHLKTVPISLSLGFSGVALLAACATVLYFGARDEEDFGYAPLASE